MRARVIPVLLIHDGGLVKTVKFNAKVYIGDPINAIRLYNDMEVDEIIVLDISATKDHRGPNFDQIEEIASEAFMPMTYGGGISSIAHIQKILRSGVEKVVINHQGLINTSLIREASRQFGSQSIVGAIDFKSNIYSKNKVYDYVIGKSLYLDPLDYAQHLQAAGIGELFLNSVDRDGVMKGYDLSMINKLSKVISIPVIACGGAGRLDDLKSAIKAGADAVGAGSLFVFHGKQRGVLINYPTQKELNLIFV